jgi:hypothetical protein
MKPRTVMATAAPLGSCRVLSQAATGFSSPASRAATMMGINRKLMRLSSQTRVPPNSRISPSRHDHAAAIRTP